MFAESFVRKQNCCIWSHEIVLFFCFFQMKKLARRHQQQQEQQNSQRLGQGRGFVIKWERKNLQLSGSVFPTRYFSTAIQGTRRSVSDACHQQWKDTKVCLSAHARLPQVLLVGSDPRGAHAEAVTSFLEEMCHVEVLALEEISRRLGPACFLLQ